MIIAELAQVHDGSLGTAHAYIDALAKTGVDAIKFQTHIAEAESSLHEPFRIKFSKQDATRFAYWKRIEFTFDQWAGLKTHCDEVGVEFISSPFSNAAVELLEKIGVKRYKIGSGEVNNFLMLEKIARTKKPILLSSGMSSFEELDKTLAFLLPYGNEIALFQCTTAYPTQPAQWGLNLISEFRKRYHLPIGFSDHSGDIYACLAAAALGAELFEFHAVFSKEAFGPDTPASISVNDIEKMVSGIKQIQESLLTVIDKSDNSAFAPLKRIFEKSLAVNKSMKAGSIIQLSDLEAKKPKGFGIDAELFQQIVGKRLIRDLEQWEFLNTEDLEP